jgi:glycosyltransferase involved in cell wall biosynthesis
MKILQVNKFYYPKDGVSNYLLALEEKLKELGHEVRVFTMDNPKNIPSPDQKYFVSYLSFDDNRPLNIWHSFTRIFYSREAKHKFQSLIDDFHPDIIHIHNIYHQISPSILSVALKNKIPVVMHLHDYKLICPNYKLFTKGAVCKRCRGGKYYNCLLNKCLKDSYLKSLGGSLEMYFHHKIWKIYEKGIKLFIAPSEFMKKTCEEFGWPEKKIICLKNFFKAPITNGQVLNYNELGDYLLYFGRLAKEKGVDVLLKALAKTDEKLKIAGEGPAEKQLNDLSASLNLKTGTGERVEFLGFKSGEELEYLIRYAKAVIIPSVWLENMPLNLLESLAQGKIIIASNIGGIPEIIKNGKNGFLFTPGDAGDLADKINNLEKIDYDSISESAIETSKSFGLDNHAQKILKIYQQALN